MGQIVVDQIQLQQVIVNLITNARDAVCGQPDARRKITIRARDTSSHCELLVEDAGEGFTDEVATRLFEPFFTTKSEGLGIGLNVCDSIVRSHGGEISASINQNGGATFLVRLPLLENSET
jgi:two-component system sensor kinase FixL